MKLRLYSDDHPEVRDLLYPPANLIPLTTAQAAKRLGVTPRRVRALIASGRLRAEYVPEAGRWFTCQDWLDEVGERAPGRPKAAHPAG